MRSVILILSLALSANSFAGIFKTKNNLQDDSLKVAIKLKSISDVLTFNQSHVAPNALEYAWEIRINTDNNDQTGDGGGYDVGLAIVNFKYGSSNSYTGTIISGTDQHTWIYDGSNATYGNSLNAYFNFADTSIILTGPRSFPELAAIDNGDEYYAYTYYDSPSGIKSDYTVPATLYSLPAIDSVNDVTESFIDLKSVSISAASAVGVKEQAAANKSTIFYPNPTTGKIFISAEGLLEVFDNKGAKVLSEINQGAIDLSQISKGMYTVKLYSGAKVTVSKLILN